MSTFTVLLKSTLLPIGTKPQKASDLKWKIIVSPFVDQVRNTFAVTYAKGLLAKILILFMLLHYRVV